MTLARCHVTLIVCFYMLLACSGCRNDSKTITSRTANNNSSFDSSPWATPGDALADKDLSSTAHTTVSPSLEEATLVAGAGRRHALLVGCSAYDNLDEWIQLRGPANDVGLMRQLLIERFEFDPLRDDIVTLAAAEDAAHQPTRTNIKREFLRLGETVQSGEPVVILMGGHGSQQPDNDPDNPDDPEPDGRDEIFLPSDVKKWDGALGTVENAIVDDDFRLWLSKIVGRGAFVWLIMDACHSGSGVRGSEAEISRQVPPEKLVPSTAFAQLSATPQADAPSEGAESSLFHTGGEGGIVAIYAAQPNETTPERMLPMDADANSQKYYGLLTYTICEILTNANHSLTYTELVQAIQTRYITMGRRSPTPLIEGSHRDNLVLGREAFPNRSRVLLERADPKTLKVTMGALQGLTAGSILAVYPPSGTNQSSEPQTLGHVKVLSSELTTAVVQAIEFNGIPANEKLPNRGRCEIIYTDFGQQQLRVLVDRIGASGEWVSDAVREKIRADLQTESSPMVTLVEDEEHADWLARWDSGKVGLIPAAGVSRSDERGHQESLPLLELDPGWSKTAIKNLERVARVQNLLRLTSVASGTMPGGELGFEMKVLDVDEQHALRWQAAGLTLHDGQNVSVVLRNNGKQSLDVTLLYVDSAYGICCLYPKLGEFNRLQSGDQQPIDLNINATTTGVENLVAIVVRGQGQPVDFSILEQPSISVGKSRGFGDDALNTPLGKLCRSVMYGSGGTRGVERSRVQDYGVKVISWRIQP